MAPELAALGAGSAAVLAGVDVVYVARRRISPVYLLDAAVELLYLGLWARAGISRRGAGKVPGSRAFFQ